MANDAPRRTRSGGRKGNARRTTSLLPPQMPWSPPINRDRPTEPLDEAGVEAIHKGCMRILSEIGIEFLNPEACEVLRKAGCKVDGTNVKMDEDFVMEMVVGYAPSQFTITPRNPDRAITMGGQHMLFGNVSSPPNSWTLERGKESGSFEMYKDFIKLTQFFNCIHFAGGYPVAHPVLQLHPFRRRLPGRAHRHPRRRPPPRLPALSLAEGLAAIVLLQCVNPGAPCAIGTFTSNVDMKTGAPAFGTPEYMRATQMTGQMGRYYGLPIRSSGVCAANVPDGQAMWETSNSLWAAVQSGTNVVYHAAGWLEGGLIASPEKFIMDCDVLQQIQRYMEPATYATTPDDIAVEAIKEVGPDGHYFGCQHTQERYETAFYSPLISDWSNFEAWELNGGTWTAERAHKMYKGIMAEFEAPPMDVAIREELSDFVARRKAEGGVETDF